MPDSMQMAADLSSPFVGSHAEWLLCSDIQRSQRGHAPFALPSITHLTFWPYGGALSVCVAG